jgi:hypothetical protein
MSVRYVSSVGSVSCPGSWIELAGVGRVLVGTGAPGSRPRFVVEWWRAGWGVESLFGGSKCAGRSIKRVLQPCQFHNGRSRAAHFTAKAMSVELCSGVSSLGLSGVWRLIQVLGKRLDEV